MHCDSTRLVYGPYTGEASYTRLVGHTRLVFEYEARMATYTRLVRVAMRLRSYEARIRGSYPARTWARIRGEGVVRHNSAKMKNTIKM